MPSKPMMRSRKKAVHGQAQWESYRKEIHTLYIKDNEPLKYIMSYMKEKHNFDAT
jgi:hypothetical protein